MTEFLALPWWAFVGMAVPVLFVAYRLYDSRKNRASGGTGGGGKGGGGPVRPK